MGQSDPTTYHLLVRERRGQTWDSGARGTGPVQLGAATAAEQAQVKGPSGPGAGRERLSPRTCQHLDFQLGSTMVAELIYCLKPLSVWSFVTAAPEK